MKKMTLNEFLNKDSIIMNVIKFSIGRGCCLERMTGISCNLNGIGKQGVIEAIKDNVEISEIIILCALDFEYTDFGVRVSISKNMDEIQKTNNW